MSNIIDGKKIANKIKENLKETVKELSESDHISPAIAVVLVGDNQASKTYVKNKRIACDKVGVKSYLFNLSNSVSEEEVLELIHDLNYNDEINGILVQLPLPPHIDQYKVLDSVRPVKDVDVFHPRNFGLLVQGRSRLESCTPKGIQTMLQHGGYMTKGKHVVIINRSNIVGKPLMGLLCQDNQWANATVTICHDNTPKELLSFMTRNADIIVVAVGIPNFLTRDMVSGKSVVVDVGINRVDGKLCGDADFDNIKDVVKAITPVPGGVGPMTIACLLENTVEAAKMQHEAKINKE